MQWVLSRECVRRTSNEFEIRLFIMEMRLQYRDFIVINTWYETAVTITLMRDRVSKAFAP